MTRVGLSFGEGSTPAGTTGPADWLVPGLHQLHPAALGRNDRGGLVGPLDQAELEPRLAGLQLGQRPPSEVGRVHAERDEDVLPTTVAGHVDVLRDVRVVP